jgi:hypothetical protein
LLNVKSFGPVASGPAHPFQKGTGRGRVKKDR